MSSYLEEHYNKFYEEKRLDSRHGQVEYRLTMKYVREALARMQKPNEEIRIADIGAGTGRYAILLYQEGYDVTAVELVSHNFGILKKKASGMPCIKGDARDLKKLKDDTFDLVLLLGPLYHLFNFEDKLFALCEAKRITRPGGVIFAGYLMNEYGLLSYGFKEGHILEVKEQGRIDGDYCCLSEEKDLYDYVRTDTIDALKDASGLSRVTIFSPDGPANYMRPVLNRLTEEEFEEFIRYQETVAERRDLLGAAAHTVDVLRKPL